MNPEFEGWNVRNRLKALAYDLLESCKADYEIEWEEYGFSPYSSIGFVDGAKPEDWAIFDAIAMRCEGCSWWVEADQINQETGLCQECEE